MFSILADILRALSRRAEAVSKIQELTTSAAQLDDYLVALAEAIMAGASPDEISHSARFNAMVRKAKGR